MPRAYPDVAGYRLLKKIAHSSSASVYLARNSDLGQMVALKVQTIQGLAGVSEEDRQRFARECEILSSLNHRSIADVIDFGITPNYLYLALEYFPCGSMRDRLKNPVSERDALNYARQIATALQIVHAAGIVHRDLKPSNLMLTTDNRVVLIDFGSARAQLVGLELSRSDLMTGTPYYVCPEQIDGSRPRSARRSVQPGHHPLRDAGGAPALSRQQSRRDLPGPPRSGPYRCCRRRNPAISRSSTGCSPRTPMSALRPPRNFSMP